MYMTFDCRPLSVSKSVSVFPSKKLSVSLADTCVCVCVCVHACVCVHVREYKCKLRHVQAAV